QHDLALDSGAGDDLVHPVERAQERGLAAAGRADERRHRARLDRHRDVLDGVDRAVVGVQPGYVDRLGHGVGGPLSSGQRLFAAVRRATSRASRLSSMMIAIRTSAPVQARSIEFWWGSAACSQMKVGSDACGPWNGSLLIALVKKIVSSSGAVSPMTRATASITPVTMPVIAVGRTTKRTVRQRGTPRA